MLALEHIITSGRLPTSTFRLTNGGEEMGLLQVRHRPSRSEGSPEGSDNHIYYQIEPAFRGQGYGKQILALGLKEAARLGLPEVVIVCNASNPASRRIIESNGGELLATFPEDDDILLKYRVPLV